MSTIGGTDGVTPGIGGGVGALAGCDRLIGALGI